MVINARRKKVRGMLLVNPDINFTTKEKPISKSKNIPPDWMASIAAVYVWVSVPTLSARRPHNSAKLSADKQKNKPLRFFSAISANNKAITDTI